MSQNIVPPSKIVIASRESLLAMWQAKHIQSRLQALYPQSEVSILGMTTQGDRILDVTLNKIGGKGFCQRAGSRAGRGACRYRRALDERRADGVAARLCAGSNWRTRRSARRFVSVRYSGLEQLPPGAVVGTSSLRRECQIRARYPHLTVEPLRGNVQTRLRKLDEGQYDAIILAAAGLRRLGLSERITALLETGDSLPAVGQGALGIENPCRSCRPVCLSGTAERCRYRRLRAGRTEMSGA